MELASTITCAMVALVVFFVFLFGGLAHGISFQEELALTRPDYTTVMTENAPARWRWPARAARIGSPV
jgi:hypothetical protein